MENQNIRNLKQQILSQEEYLLKKVSFEYHTGAHWEKQEKEVYDRGNAAAVLLYNTATGSIILNRQFRIPTYLNGNADGMLFETCAGKLAPSESPEAAIKREVMEETGYEIKDFKQIFQAYMSPGSVTEFIYFFLAPYQPDMKVNAGGGKEEEHEHIEVVEISFVQALDKIKRREIKDGKTIMLLQYAELYDLFKL